MGKAFEEIKRGLEEALAYEKGVLDPTGTVLSPGDPQGCLGGENHPEHPLCCDNCDHFLKCYPEHQGELEEALEQLRETKAQ